MQTNDYRELSAEEVFCEYGDMLYRICVVMLKSRQDAEDVLQDVLIKYMERRDGFADADHRKAWLIRVTINMCKNKLLFYKRHPQVPIEQMAEFYQKEEDARLMDSLRNLPVGYKEVMFLHYVEGYKIRETAQILKLTEQTVKKRLERSRKKLKDQLYEEGRLKWN